MSAAKNKLIRLTAWVLGIIVLLWALVLTAIQLVVKTDLLTRLVDRAAATFVDGRVSYGGVRISVLESFPNLNLQLDSVSVTYPHDRWAGWDLPDSRYPLLRAGRGAESDTLASFDRLSASINYMALLNGEIRSAGVTLSGLRLYAHRYGDGAANWQMFRTGGDKKVEEEEDKESSGFDFTSLSVGQVTVDGRPILVYTSQTDSLAASLRMNRLVLRDNGKRFAFGLDGRSFLYTPGIGRLMVPFHFDGEVGIRRSRRQASQTLYQLRHFDGSLAYVPLQADVMARKSADSLFVRASLKTEDCSLGEVLRHYGKNIDPKLADVHTDARLSFSADCRGYLDASAGLYPESHASLSLPDAYVTYEPWPDTCRVALQGAADLSADGELTGQLSRLGLSVGGLEVDLSGQGSRLLSDDPLFVLRGNLSAELARLVALLPDSTGDVSASGRVTLDVDASARRSQLNAKGLPYARLQAVLKGDRVDVSYPKIGLVADLDSLSLTAQTMKSLVDSTARAVGVAFRADTLHLGIGENLSFQGHALTLLANLRPKRLNDSVVVPEFKGKVKADRLVLTGSDSLRVAVGQTDNSFTIATTDFFGQRPRLSVVSDTRSIALAKDCNLLRFRDMQLRLGARRKPEGLAGPSDRNALRTPWAGDAPWTSLPDSLLKRMPAFLTESDFDKGDIDIQVSQDLRQWLDRWFLSGDLRVERAALMTPQLPLRNRVDSLHLSFAGQRFSIDRFDYRLGRSNLSVGGTLTARRPRFIDKPLFRLDADIVSDSIDVDELILAWHRGKQLRAERTALSLEAVEAADVDRYMETLLTAAEAQTVDENLSSLLVVPANLRAEVRLRADNVRYDSLLVDTLYGRLASAGRCLSLTDWNAATNMGNIHLDAFYSTQSKQNITAGFNLIMEKITADEVISLIPAVDTVIPLLKAFQGDLDCSLTATTRLDTMMNIILPSLNGVFKIGGSGLMIGQSPVVDKVARRLLMRRKWDGTLDDMSISGVVSDNVLDVFPFILRVDRYTLALEGRQQIKTRFDYYISVISSPIPFQFGIDLYGPSFSDMKYGIGPTKYTHSYHIPVFSRQVDSLQVNLVTSLKDVLNRGAERVILSNEQAARATDSLRTARLAKPVTGDSEENRRVLERYRKQEAEMEETK